jgi:hypothetical protein
MSKVDSNYMFRLYVEHKSARQVPLVEHELLILPEHLSSPPVFSEVRVTRSLVLCVFCRLLFVLLYFFFWPLIEVVKRQENYLFLSSGKSWFNLFISIMYVKRMMYQLFRHLIIMFIFIRLNVSWSITRSSPWLGWLLWNICVTNDHWYVLLVNTSQSFPHSWLYHRVSI